MSTTLRARTETISPALKAALALGQARARTSVLLVLLVASVLSSAAEDKSRLIRTTPALTPAEEQTKLHVPQGFTVQLFASEPMINKPINIAFDARGRLWVSSTTEYPFPAKGEGRDAIKVLEDTDHDGRADKVTTFADKLNIPTGVLPWGEGCIAFSIPNIWYLRDTDGDGHCDKREILFGPLGYEKDTHGMCSSFRLGLDGWVYATHGFNNTSHFKAKDGSTLTLHSGNTFRFRPDGSKVELWTSGQVNPFGLCWDRYNNLYSADCHSNPITQLLRGACYQSFGKPHDGLGFAPVMATHSHGSTGLCGVVYLDGNVWGDEWDDHMLVGNCVTSKINHDTITFQGSTPTAKEAPDFLTSDDPWFRPVDLQLGPDSALYVADFYNKIIGHYEVPLDHPERDRERGRIWRIVKTDLKSAPTDFTTMDSKTIATELGSANLTRRHHALREVKRRGTKDWLTELGMVFDPGKFGDLYRYKPQGDARPSDMPTWDTEPSDGMGDAWMRPDDLRAAYTLWALSYLGERLTISQVMRGHHTGGWWVQDDRDDMGRIIADRQPGLVMSHAAQVIGNYERLHPWEKWNLGMVFDCRGSAAGRAVCQALLHRPDILGGSPLWQGHTVSDLVELLQNMIAPFEIEKNAPWQNPQDTAYILSMKLLLRDWLAQPHVFNNTLWHDDKIMEQPWFYELLCSVPSADVSRYLITRHTGSGHGALRQIAMHGDERTVESALIILRRSPPDCFPAMHEGFLQRGGNIPPAFYEAAADAAKDLLTEGKITRSDWRETLQAESPWCLQERQCADGQTALVLSSLNKDLKTPEPLTGTLRSKPFHAPAKFRFWLCGHQGFPNTAANQKSAVRLMHEGEVIEEAFPPRTDVCQRVEWNLSHVKGKEVHLEIVDGDSGSAYAWIGITRIEPAMIAVDTFSSASERAKHLRALANILRTTAPIALRDQLAKYLPASPKLEPAKPQPELDSLIKARIASFSQAKPNLETGATLFKANCAVCHQIKGQGGHIGPQLDGIGQRGHERLMEDILDPNRNVDAHFRLHQITRRDGSTASGFVRGEVGQLILLVHAAGNEQRIAKGDITDDKELTQSLMPPTFGQTLSAEATCDLIAWLLKQ